MDGRYALAEVIGHGTGTVVHRARDLASGAEVAVKRWLPGPPRDRWFAERVRRELGILRVLDHPGLARVIDVGVADGLPYAVLELVDGTPLARGPIARAVALCAALAAAHGYGVVHGDVRPRTVLVTRDGRVKLVGWGERAPGLPSDFSCFAPELARGEIATRATDVYGVGCLVHVLLTGRPPFHRATPAEVVHGHVTAPPPALPGPLGPLVTAALAKAPGDRPGLDELARGLGRDATG